MKVRIILFVVIVLFASCLQGCEPQIVLNGESEHWKGIVTLKEMSLQELKYSHLFNTDLIGDGSMTIRPHGDKILNKNV